MMKRIVCITYIYVMCVMFIVKYTYLFHLTKQATYCVPYADRETVFMSRWPTYCTYYNHADFLNVSVFPGAILDSAPSM